MRRYRKLLTVLTSLLLVAAMILGMSMSVSALSENKNKKQAEQNDAQLSVEEDGEYTSKDEVALYLFTYKHLPSNYITKWEANDLGWRGGPLWEYAPGKSLGGSKFGNYEELLPLKEGRKYYECDIDYDGGKRNAKRIIWSDDGLIFYTEDHYKTFEQLYDEEGKICEK